MQVRSIRLTNFMNHDQTHLALPDVGLVLVSGENGSGKSTLAEAVSVAGWGKTLRGKPAWRLNADSEVVVETEDLLLKRDRSASNQVSLEWTLLSGTATPFQSTTISQEILEERLGPWDVWRRTHCFSSQDAAHFTMSTDGERKRLLETLLGIGKFDAALKLHKIDRDKCSAMRNTSERKLLVITTKIEGEERRRDEAERSLSIAEVGEVGPAQVLADPKDLERKILKLAALESQAVREVSELREQLRALDQTLSVNQERLREAKERAKLFESGKCPVCSQAIPEDMRSATARLVSTRLSEVEAARIQVSQQREGLLKEIAEIGEEGTALSQRRTELRLKLADISAETRRIQEVRKARERSIQLRSHAETVLAEVNASLASLFVDQGVAKREVETLDKELLVLDAVQTVLGLKGFRAHVLGRALGGVEAVANRWLADIAGPGFTLSLKASRDLKKGGVSDEIALEIEGAGGGYGYKASSGGERRRIDVALVLALAEVAAAANEGSKGTLFFDEVFDSLDGVGIEAVSSVLKRLSEKQTVIVISHREMTALKPTMRVLVESGKLTVR